MNEPKTEAPKFDEAARDQKISRHARVARRLEKIAMYGTQQDKQAYRQAARQRDIYIDSVAGQP